MITNPSYDDFKNSGHKIEATKECDMFVFSVYSCRIDDDDKMLYIGILKNFFEFESQYSPPKTDSEIKEWQP